MTDKISEIKGLSLVEKCSMMLDVLRCSSHKILSDVTVIRTENY